MLEAALVGLQHRREEIEKKMIELRELIGKPAPAPKERVLSPAARKRIAAAQKKRWEAFREAKAQRAKPRAAKRGSTRRRRAEKPAPVAPGGSLATPSPVV